MSKVGGGGVVSYMSWILWGKYSVYHLFMPVYAEIAQIRNEELYK